jgi:hypothetical protein
LKIKKRNTQKVVPFFVMRNFNQAVTLPINVGLESQMGPNYPECDFGGFSP